MWRTISITNLDKFSFFKGPSPEMCMYLCKFCILIKARDHMVVDPIELGVVVVQDYGSCFCLFEGGGGGRGRVRP